MLAVKLAVVVVVVALVAAPVARAEAGDQASAEAAVGGAYVEKIAHCHATRNASPAVQSISWSQFVPRSGGQGTVHDADPRLGGDFTAYYSRLGHFSPPPGGFAIGGWFINFLFC